MAKCDKCKEKCDECGGPLHPSNVWPNNFPNNPPKWLHEQVDPNLYNPTHGTNNLSEDFKDINRP